MLKISVVTVSFNAAATIEQTILSVLNQTYQSVEYIMIDGGSTDGTVDIIRKYADRLAYWVSEPDNGIYDAMNKGIAAATGDYINFMNAGDSFFTPDTIRSIADAANGESVIYGNICQRFHCITRVLRGITARQPRLIDFVHDTIHHQSAFIKRALFLKYGLYSTEYKLMSDWLFFFETIYVHNESAKYVDACIANFRMDGVSSRNTACYLEERRSYLIARYGAEWYAYVSELMQYRSCRLAKWLVAIKQAVLENARYRDLKQYLKQKI